MAMVFGDKYILIQKAPLISRALFNDIFKTMDYRTL